MAAVDSLLLIAFIVCAATLFNWVLARERVPQEVASLLLGVSDDPLVMLLLINVLLFFLGMFMEALAIMVLTVPVLMPVVTALGIDPVHFGLVFIIAATIGNYTPPVGAAMFVVCQVLRCPIGEYTRESVPFLIAVSLVTLLLIFVPGVVLVVPNWLFGQH